MTILIAKNVAGMLHCTSNQSNLPLFLYFLALPSLFPITIFCNCFIHLFTLHYLVFSFLLARSYSGCDNLPFFMQVFLFFLGADEDATDKAFRAWVAQTIADNSTKEERPELKTVPAGYPGPRVDLIGCVHLITVAHLNTVKEAFQSCQWALECERHNKYAGSMVEVCGSQAKMQMCTNKIGPFRP